MSRVRDVIAFDCDGVLLDSNQMKIACFVETIRDLGFDAEAADWFAGYVAANFGRSRQRLFAALLARYAADARPHVGLAELTNAYAKKLYDRYVSCPETQGMRAVVDQLAEAGFRLAVVSGSDEDELRRVLTARGLAARFNAILGAPRTKPELLAEARSRFSEVGSKCRCLTFVGDAEADFRAAMAADARFVYMDRYGTARSRLRLLRDAHGFPMISDLTDLPLIVGLDPVAP